MGIVSGSTIAGLAIVGAICILVPIALVIIFKIKAKANILPVIFGALTFVVFALILEAIPKVILFGGTTSVSKYVLSNAWAYVLIGCLLAGVFEEVGRYLTMRFCLKKYNDKKDAVMFGLGHGGIENILLIGITYISYIAIAVTVNAGGIDAILATVPAEQVEAAKAQVNSIASLTASVFLLTIVERVLAETLHVALSFVVFRSVKEKGKGIYLLYAILLHMVFDVPAALYQCKVISLPVCEICLFIILLVIAFIVYRMYKKYQSPVAEQIEVTEQTEQTEQNSETK